jgi:helicase
MSRELKTASGVVRFPAFVPVTTFGSRFPLDPLIRPYLPLLAQAAMVSYPYAVDLPRPGLRIPLFIDSGGFACLLPGGRVEEEAGLGVLVVEREGEEVKRIHPRDVLELQERVADVAFTLDFPCPPGLDSSEAARRVSLSHSNAVWALRNRRRRNLPLFAGVQGLDVAHYRQSARALAVEPFDGFAVGGLVPRARDRVLVLEIARAVRGEVGERPLHAFGLGQPDLLAELFGAGIDSADSSSYLKLAADGRRWGASSAPLGDPSPAERLQLALCNLAVAASRTVPISASGLVFTTLGLPWQR